jgi:formate dehydrogenase assembly factor FdhD
MAILKDVKTGERFQIQLCKYCTDFDGRPKPILPNDMGARRERDGSYKCGTCIQESIDNSIIKTNPNSVKSQKILRRRKHEQMIDEINKRIYERSKRKV